MVLPKFDEVFLNADGVMPKALEVMPKAAQAIAKVKLVKDKGQIAHLFFGNASPFFEAGYRVLARSIPHLWHSVAELCDGVGKMELSDCQNRRGVSQIWKCSRQIRSAFFTCVNISLFFGMYSVFISIVFRR